MRRGKVEKRCASYLSEMTVLWCYFKMVLFSTISHNFITEVWHHARIVSPYQKQPDAQHASYPGNLPTCWGPTRTPRIFQLSSQTRTLQTQRIEDYSASYALQTLRLAWKAGPLNFPFFTHYPSHGCQHHRPISGENKRSSKLSSAHWLHRAVHCF